MVLYPLFPSLHLKYLLLLLCDLTVPSKRGVVRLLGKRICGKAQGAGTSGTCRCCATPLLSSKKSLPKQAPALTPPSQVTPVYQACILQVTSESNTGSQFGLEKYYMNES